MEINAETLRCERDKRGLSQKKFAKFLGVSFRSYQDYETGKKIPDGKKLLIQSKLYAKDAYQLKKVSEDVIDEKEKPSQDSARVEDLIAKKVMEELNPIMRDYMDKILQAVGNLDLDFQEIKNMQEELKELQEKTMETIENKH